VVWGLYHGLFLILERTRFGSFVESLPQFLKHLYTLIVIVAGWVFFRADTFSHATAFLGAMAGFAHGVVTEQMRELIFTHQVAWAMLAGIIFSAPFGPWFKKELLRLLPAAQSAIHLAGIMAEPVLLTALLVISAAWLAGGTYNPFIYFRF
jgi:alginate O-acetyltransferase complex protein AlgI